MFDWIAQALKSGAASGALGAAAPGGAGGIDLLKWAGLGPGFANGALEGGGFIGSVLGGGGGGGDPTSAASWAANTEVYEPKGLIGKLGIETTADQRKALMDGTSQAIRDFTKGAESPFQRAPAAAPPPNTGPQLGASGMSALMGRGGGRPPASPFQPAGRRGIWG